MKNFIFIICSFLYIGCATYTGGYMPKTTSKAAPPLLSEEQKRDVSFSISYYQQVGSEIIISEKSITKGVKTALEKSNLFRHVYNIPLDSKSTYHYHFDVKLTGTSPEDQMSLGLISGYTLLIIPTFFNYYIDTTMYLFVDNREVFSSTVSEKITDFVWLPLVATWPFMNHGTIGLSLKKKILRHFIHEIVQNKLYEYPMHNEKKNSVEERFNFLYE